ncbi:pantoate--beta-alanine ligase [Magnetofaba australis]|uniref:Pantothenate synthetase n=1 Tax=Magnetofaba australis IT-1 TaxID=1434232 RepID=A0A1Y2K3N8_9PROT|nr:pantoate--beta-alanine ligase [Magnetofaba australis]OSM03940.1 putative pantothenate synthetase [Magnetofaba australis IT-1]
MRLLESRADLSAWQSETLSGGHSIGFVPTMGCLHDGHLSLVRTAAEENGRALASIFVNPAQFAEGEDYDRYPRTLEADMALLEQSGCDALFYPRESDIYPEGFQSIIAVEPLSSELCGAARPGHFQGVATVVAILLNLTMPTRCYLGLKDYQQFTILRRMVQDLAMPYTLVGMPTVREADGLAMSSRNRYLQGAEREQAAALYRGLSAARSAWSNGERDPQRLEATARAALTEAGIERIDYVAARHPLTLAPWQSADPIAPVVLMAAHVGAARLIDNLRLDDAAA